MENNNATLVEAKKAYTNQLISLITPQVYEGIKDLYECAKKNMKGKNVRHSFQIELSGVSVWNQLIIDNETERIIKNTNCGYLDKLVTVIFINSTKILASSYIGSQDTNTLEISVPKLSHFIHRVYIETAKEFYKNPFLLDENLRPRERQDNLRSSIKAIKFGIEQAILRLLPIGEILSRDVASNIPQLEGPVQETTSTQEEEVDFDEIIDETLDEASVNNEDIEEESDDDTEEVEQVLETTETVTEEPVVENTETTETVTEVVEDVSEPVLENTETPDTETPDTETEELVLENTETPDTETEELVLENTETPDTETEELVLENTETQETVSEPVLENIELEGGGDIVTNESASASDEENFVTEKVSQTGSVEDGLSVENINEVNKEFIEEKKEDPTLVDDIVEEINLKNIELEDTKVEEKSTEPLTINKMEESVVVEDIEEPSTPRSPVLEDVRETVQEEETVLEPERSMEGDVEELNEESVPLENVEENINMEVVHNVRREDVADRTNEMLKSMKRDLHMNKKRFVNPYRAKHHMNEKRRDRLRNIRVKKNSGLGLSQYL
jgi:hypothetical protein